MSTVVSVGVADSSARTPEIQNSMKTNLRWNAVGATTLPQDMQGRTDERGAGVDSCPQAQQSEGCKYGKNLQLILKNSLKNRKIERRGGKQWSENE
jgi:hypothetical protein